MKLWRSDVDGARWGLDFDSEEEYWLRLWPDPLLYLGGWRLGIDAEKTFYGPGEKPRRKFYCGRGVDADR